MIRVCKMDDKVWEHLVERGFLTPVCGEKALSSLPEEAFKVETLFQCDAYGGNKLIRVGMNLTWPAKFHYHEAHEQVFLISREPAKPLFMVFSYDCLEEFTRKQKAGALSEKDFIIVEMVFNHPKYSVFAVNPGVLHGEFTAGGDRPNPQFIVTEPSGLETKDVDVKELYGLFAEAMKKEER